MLWEKATDFSPRYTELLGVELGRKRHVFSDVIRVWYVLLQHDDVNSAIARIVKSYERGLTANECHRVSLKNAAAHFKRLTQKNVAAAHDSDGAVLTTPNIYVASAHQGSLPMRAKPSKKQPTQQLQHVPRGTVADDSFTLEKFYTLSASMVSMLVGLADQLATRCHRYSDSRACLLAF